MSAELVYVHAQQADTDFLIYTGNFCGYCTALTRLLNGKDLSYTEYNFDDHAGLRKQVVAATGHRTVPVVFDLREDDFQWTPYIHSGITYFKYNALHYPIGISTASKYGNDSSFAIPITFGFKVKPIRDFVIGFEVSAKHTFTDNLDGSNPKYKNMDLYSQKAFGSDLSQDWYVFTGFTLTYIFGFEPCYCPK